jgi:ABC-2 type transport system permease protein
MIMGTFKAYFKKEMIESIRTYRYLILAVGILIFAIADPVMMKLLPLIMKNQTNGADLSALFVVNNEAVLQMYIKDSFQIGSMFVVFTMSSILSDEKNTQKFVFPYAKGASQAGIVLAKILHYCIFIFLMTIIGVCVSHYYTGILIKGAPVPFETVLFVGLMISAYYIFYSVVATFFSAIVGKGLAAGFITLGIAYLSVFANNIKSVNEFLPYMLINNANGMHIVDCSKTIIACIVCSAILIFFTIRHMKKAEII